MTRGIAALTYARPCNLIPLPRRTFAVLFGNGSLGGVATTMTKQARFDTNFAEIAQTFGSWNNSRTTLDVNRGIGNRLAVRASAVYTDTDGWREKQFEKVRAAFLTTSFSLASDSPVIAERFKDLQLTADHRIGDLFLQAAIDVNRSNQRINNIDVRNSNVMYVDINRILPNDTANTHFLQRYYEPANWNGKTVLWKPDGPADWGTLTYTPVYSPASYYTVVATMGYTLRLERKREVRFDLRVNNLLNAQGPIFGVSTALRPKNGDLTTPARVTVANVYSYKTPASVNLTTTLKF